MTFRRTVDYGLVRSVLCHPRLFPHLGDDFSPSAAEWRPVEDDRLWYVAAEDAGDLLGIFTFVPLSTVCWEIHCALLPHCWGPRAKRALVGVLPWVCGVSSCRRVLASVPVTNRAALGLAGRAGMERLGVNRASFQKGGRLVDQIWWGYSPGEAKQCLV